MGSISRVSVEALLTKALYALAAADFPLAETYLHKLLLYDSLNLIALLRLAALAYSDGRMEEAEVLLRQAYAAHSSDLEALFSLCRVLRERGKLEEALELGLRFVEMAPHQAEGWNFVGICLQESMQPARAVECYLRALGLKPEFPEALSNLAVIQIDEKDYIGAIQNLNEALLIEPGLNSALLNLGCAKRAIYRYCDAIDAFQKLYDRDPDFPDVEGALGEVLSLLYAPESEALLRRAVERDPSNASLRLNLALELLRRGKYSEGFRAFENRRSQHAEEDVFQRYEQPIWRGEPVAPSSVLLVHPEQGFGDSLQFSRFLRFTVDRFEHVYVKVQEPLTALFAEYSERFLGRMTVLEPNAPIPHFDFHCPMVNLALAAGTTAESVPVPERLTAASAYIPDTPRLRIGIAWAGNAMHARDRERSLPLAALHPLFELKDIIWVSLQVGPPIQEAAQLGIAMEWPALTDFASTANVLDTLDLVISCDSAVAHLAGTQAIPTWLLLPYVADWRWGLPGETPNRWYPEMRIFQQAVLPSGEPQLDLWKPVICSVIEALKT